MKGRFVAYYRVSTAKQGRSGLGLEAQQNAVHGYLNGHKLVAEHTEVEGGGRRDRPVLEQALADCRLHAATLVIAKLDRLARNVAFVSTLMDADVEFVACDFPEANRLTIHILAAMAEHEAAMTSQRTKDALAAARARGVRLGNPDNLTNAARRQGTVASAVTRGASADQRARDLWPTLTEMVRRDPSPTLRAMALELTAKSIPAPRGGAWSATQVSRVLARARALQPGRAIDVG